MLIATYYVYQFLITNYFCFLFKAQLRHENTLHDIQFIFLET